MYPIYPRDGEGNIKIRPIGYVRSRVRHEQTGGFTHVDSELVLDPEFELLLQRDRRILPPSGRLLVERDQVLLSAAPSPGTGRRARGGYGRLPLTRPPQPGRVEHSAAGLQTGRDAHGEWSGRHRRQPGPGYQALVSSLRPSGRRSARPRVRVPAVVLAAFRAADSGRLRPRRGCGMGMPTVPARPAPLLACQPLATRFPLAGPPPAGKLRRPPADRPLGACQSSRTACAPPPCSGPPLSTCGR